MVAAGCSRGSDRVRSTRDSLAVSTGNEAAAAAPGRGGCRFITETEASATLDQPTRYRAEPPSPQSCTLEPASGDAFHGVTVTYRVVPGGRAQYDFIAAQKKAQPVSGLGDRALWLAAGGRGGNLVVIHGTDVVSLTITDPTGRGQLEQRARDLARTVLEHL